MTATLKASRQPASQRPASRSAAAVKPGSSTVTPLSQLSDEQLVSLYRGGQQADVFAELVRRHERELYNYLRRYLGHAALAEDVFQATFLQVHLKCADYDTTKPFKPWLYRIATNKAIDALRRGRRHRLVSLDQPQDLRGGNSVSLVAQLAGAASEPQAELERKEHGIWAHAAVNKLPDHLRAVVDLVFFGKMKYSEAAEALSIPLGTVKSRMHAALVRLNAAWQASHPGEIVV